MKKIIDEHGRRRDEMKTYRIYANANGTTDNGYETIRTVGTRSALRRALLKAARVYGIGGWARIEPDVEATPENWPIQEIASVRLSRFSNESDIFMGEAE